MSIITYSHDHEQSAFAPVKWTANLAKMLWKAYVNWRMISNATRHLEKLDDRLLSDIGISRSEIATAVNLGLVDRTKPIRTRTDQD